MKYWKKFFTKRMNEWNEGKKISAGIQFCFFDHLKRSLK